jgi:hypothetical protein
LATQHRPCSLLSREQIHFIFHNTPLFARMKDHIRVLETNEFLAMEMADTLLTDASVPHFVVEFTKSGTSFEMPCAPSFGRGFHWQVVVPRENVVAAEAALEALPFERAQSMAPLPNRETVAASKRWSRYCYILLAAVLILTLVLSLCMR